MDQRLRFLGRVLACHTLQQVSDRAEILVRAEPTKNRVDAEERQAYNDALGRLLTWSRPVPHPEAVGRGFRAVSREAATPIRERSATAMRKNAGE